MDEGGGGMEWGNEKRMILQLLSSIDLSLDTDGWQSSVKCDNYKYELNLHSNREGERRVGEGMPCDG